MNSTKDYLVKVDGLSYKVIDCKNPEEAIDKVIALFDSGKVLLGIDSDRHAVLFKPIAGVPYTISSISEIKTDKE